MREFFLTDTHWPNEDKEVMSIACQMIKDIKPDLIWLGGDMLDNESISPFDKSIEAKNKWVEHKEYAIKQLQNLRKIAPKAQIIYKEGNHCVWLRKHILRNTPVFQNETALTWPALLKLNECDIEFIPDTKFTKVGKLLHLHGHEKQVGSAFPAKGLYDRFGTSLIAGHFHRASFYGARTFDNEHGAHTIGCSRSFNVDFDKFVNWQHGFANIDYSKSGFFNVNQIIVINDKHEKQKCAVFEGKVYYPNKVVKL